VDIDHPNVIDFIQWKSHEEEKAKALIAAGYESDFNGEAYKTISGQNGNNSVSVCHDFMKALDADADWDMWWVLDKQKYQDKNGNVSLTDLKENCKPAASCKAKFIWDEMVDSAWKCADPGIHFNGIMNDWNTLASDGRIRSTNPCLSGDTLVYVVENNDSIKKIKIKDIKDENVNIVSYDFQKQKVIIVNAKNLGITRSNTKIIKIKTTKGEIKLTPDHEIMTNRGWIQAKDLQSGDKVYKIKKLNNKSFLTSEVNNKLIYPSRKEQILLIEKDNKELEEIEILSVDKVEDLEDVYDFNVPKHHCFFTDELLVSNCSEFVSLDNSACNLASINLAKFIDELQILWLNYHQRQYLVMFGSIEIQDLDQQILELC